MARHRPAPVRSIRFAAAIWMLALAAEGQQPSDAGQALRLAEQKARMLESFLASDRIAGIEATGGAGALVATAREALARARAALDHARHAEASADLDAGLAALSRASAQVTREQSQAPRPAAAFDRRRAQAHSLVDTLARIEGLSAAQETRLAAVRAGLARADALRAEGAIAVAWDALDGAYAEVVGLVTAVQDGQTHVVSHTFATAEEALDHERARHTHHRLLVRLVLTERAEAQPGLAVIARQLVALAEEQRGQAEALADAGRTGEAVETMQHATERLLAVLRSAGLVLTEQALP